MKMKTKTKKAKQTKWNKKNTEPKMKISFCSIIAKQKFSLLIARA